MKTSQLVVLLSFSVAMIEGALASPVKFEIVKVFSSINAEFRESSGAAPNSFYEEVFGSSTASLSGSLQLGRLYTSQAGAIAADPAAGRITASGSSVTRLLPPNSSSGDSTEGGGFRTWGKHVVVGRFVVPNVGRVFTDVYLDIEISESDGGQALYLMDKAAKWDMANVTADGYTPWGGLGDSELRILRYRPGEEIYFAVGIEPGVGMSGGLPAMFEDRDSIAVTFEFLTDTPIPSIPEPGIGWLLIAGAIGGLGRAGGWSNWKWR